MKQSSFIPEYVEYIPSELEEGRLYISRRFRTASHLCACGCGSTVVTPLKPAKWELTENKNGEVSLSPSIGRWQSCKSHYWIHDNQVEWARAFSEEEMQSVLERDGKDLRDYYESRQKARGLIGFLTDLWRKLFKGKRSH